MNRNTCADKEYQQSCCKYLEDLVARRDFPAACEYFDSIQDIWNGKSDLEGGIILRLGAKAFGLSGELSRALTLIRRSISVLTRCVGEAEELAECYIVLGDILRELGQYHEAEKSYRDAESIFRRNDNYSGSGMALNLLAGILFKKGELDASLRCLLDAIEYAKKENNKRKLAYLFGNVGRIFTLMGKLQAAEDNIKMNVELSASVDDEVELARAQLSLGYVNIQLGRYDRAAEALEKAADYIQRNNMRKEAVIHQTYLGELKLASGRLDEAESLLDKAAADGHRIAPESLLATRPIRHLAQLMIKKGHLRKALQLANKAMVTMKQLDDDIETGALLKIQAVCQAGLGNRDKAIRAFAVSIEALEEARAKFELADCLAEAGKTTVFGSNQRTMYLCRAEELYRRCGMKARETEMQKLIGSVDTTERSETGDETPQPEAEFNITSRNPQMKKILAQMRLLKKSDIPILLTGETGTGKDYLAEYFHSLARPSGPFVSINCAAVPENLIEAELFGHRKGAFTGADRDRRGHFLAADKGVLLLDEIGELPLGLQAKLLNVLETKKLRPLGSSKEVEVDVLIIAATNRDLSEMVRAGTFRQDLYYRLAGITFELPPLRERKEDIPDLVAHFMRRYDLLGENEKPEGELIRHFVGFDWPGNIRQLENEIKQLSALAAMTKEGSILELSRTFYENRQEESSRSLVEQVESFEKQLLVEALIASNGNKSEAARQLSIHESTFRAKMKRHGLEAAVN